MYNDDSRISDLDQIEQVTFKKEAGTPKNLAKPESGHSKVNKSFKVESQLDNSFQSQTRTEAPRNKGPKSKSPITKSQAPPLQPQKTV